MIHLEQKVCGFYKLEAVKKDESGKETKRLLADWFPNLITNTGLDRMHELGYFSNLTPTIVPTGILPYCMVGTGNAVPAFTDSVLSNQLAVTNSTEVFTVTAETGTPYYRKLSITYRFAEGDAAGNVAEVGIGWLDAPTYYCFSRALILDGVGSPTTITVLSDEWLDVSYEYRIYPKETDDTGTVVFTGSIGGTYDWIARLADASDWTNYANAFADQLSMGIPCFSHPTREYVSTDNLTAISTKPTAEGGITQGAVDGYTPGNYYSVHAFELSLSQGNLVGGVRTIVVGVGTCYYQIQFDDQANPGTGIPKADTDILTFKFKVSWGRV